MPPIIELSIVGAVIIWIYTFYTHVFRQLKRVEPKAFMAKFILNIGKVSAIAVGLFVAYQGVRFLIGLHG